MALLEQAYGPDHPELAAALRELGVVLTLQGQPEAVAYLERALAIAERALGAHHPATGMILYALADAEKARADHRAAEARIRAAIEVLTAAVGEDHSNVGAAWDSLGTILGRQERLDEALVALERGRAIRARTVGTGHVNYAISLNNLGWMSRRLERHREAVGHYETLLAIESLPADHIVVPYAHFNAGEAYLALGEVDRALDHYRRALARLEAIYGPDHAEVALPLVGLGNALARRRDYATALPLLERAFAVGGDEGDPLTRGELAQYLAQALWDSGRDRPRARRLAAEAEALLRQAGSARAAEVAAWRRARR